MKKSACAQCTHNKKIKVFRFEITNGTIIRKKRTKISQKERSKKKKMNFNIKHLEN